MSAQFFSGWEKPIEQELRRLFQKIEETIELGGTGIMMPLNTKKNDSVELEELYFLLVVACSLFFTFMAMPCLAIHFLGRSHAFLDISWLWTCSISDTLNISGARI
ncbi:MAG: hypothetical protein ACYC6O_08760 [Thermoleophilia bacterium]